MLDLSLLSKFAARESTKFYGAPFTTTVNGVKWSVATDLRMMLAIQVAGTYPDLKELKKRLSGDERSHANSTNDSVRAILQGASGPKIPTKTLKDWAGPVTWDFDNSSPFGSSPIQPGKVFGKYWDRRRIACILDGVPDQEVQLWDTTTTTPFDSLTLVGDGWRGSVAGLKVEGLEEDVPELLVETSKTAPREAFSSLDLIDLVD